MGLLRHDFDAVLLGDGTILAVGDDWSCQPGGAHEGSETAEQYDPGTDTWVAAASLNKPRKAPATVVLQDGSAMVIGGVNTDDISFSSTKRFDPLTRAWANGPLLGIARSQPFATTLGDGRVLVMNKASGTSTEIYDPRTSLWNPGPELPHLTEIVDLVALGDDSALAIGLFGGDSDPVRIAYRYDPAREVWVGVDAPGGFGYEAVAMPDGGVLAIGGTDGGDLSGGTGAMTGAVSRFDDRTGRWTTGTPMPTKRTGAQTVALRDGRVLVAGGMQGDDVDNSQALRTTEIYNPATDRWTTTGDLRDLRMDGNAIRLDDGSVVVLGGNNAFNIDRATPFCPPPLTSVERFFPGP